MSNFSIFQTGLRSLRAHQQALDTTAHNIANANTPGYSRQRAEMNTFYPIAQPGLHQGGKAGQLGTGVHVTEISQMRDYFLDQQMRSELSRKGTWDGEKEILARIETFLNEPSDEGLAATFAQFFKDLEALSQHPESTAQRQSVIENARMLTDSFNQVSRQLSNYREDLNDSVEARITEVNSLAERIADLNSQIVKIKGDGENPNDLMDQRQLLTEELSELIDINVKEDNVGNWNISVGGFQLVEDDTTRTIEVYEDDNNEDMYGLRWEHNQRPVNLNSGEVEALIRGRDDYIDGFQTSLNELARTLGDEFNAIHNQGYGLDGSTGLDFFEFGEDDGNEAALIRVNEDIANNRAKFAASGIFVRDLIDGTEEEGLFVSGLTPDAEFEITEGETPAVNVDDDRVEVTVPDDYTYQDIAELINEHEEASELVQISFSPEMEDEVIGAFPGEVALTYPGGVPEGNADNIFAMLEFRDERVMEDGSTMEDFYRAITSEIGVLGQKADRMGKNQDDLLSNIEQRREEISGVSLDEEMANMIRFQHGYNAASQMISRMDQMMESLIAMVR